MSIGALSGGPGAQPNINKFISQQFQAADKDKSGGISLEEFKKANSADQAGGAQGPSQAQAEKFFKKLDGDGDGQITKSEITSAFKKEASQRFSSDTMSSLLSVQENSGGQQASGNSSQSAMLSALLKSTQDNSSAAQASKAQNQQPNPLQAAQR